MHPLLFVLLDRRRYHALFPSERCQQLSRHGKWGIGIGQWFSSLGFRVSSPNRSENVPLHGADPQRKLPAASIDCQTEVDVLTRPAFETIMATLQKSYTITLQQIEGQMAERVQTIEPLRRQVQHGEPITAVSPTTAGVAAPMVDDIRVDQETSNANNCVWWWPYTKRHARERQALKEQRRSEQLSVLQRLHGPDDQPG